MSELWRADARCLTVGPDVMFPDATGPAATEQIREAKAVCDHCLVTAACLTFALEREGADSPAYRAGIWGGTSPRERAAIARRTRTAA